MQDEENGLLKKRSVAPFNLSVLYRPTDLLVLQEVGNSRDTAELNRAHAKYGNYAYFILDIDLDGKNALYGGSQDMGDFSEKLQVLAFRMADRVNLITSEKDTIEVADYIFNRTYGMGSTTLMFVFSNEKLKDAEWFTFNLKDFGFGVGDQRFRFQMKDLSNVPKLLDIYPLSAVRLPLSADSHVTISELEENVTLRPSKNDTPDIEENVMLRLSKNATPDIEEDVMLRPSKNATPDIEEDVMLRPSKHILFPQSPTSNSQKLVPNSQKPNIPTSQKPNTPKPNILNT